VKDNAKIAGTSDNRGWGVDGEGGVARGKGEDKNLKTEGLFHVPPALEQDNPQVGVYATYNRINGEEFNRKEFKEHRENKEGRTDGAKIEQKQTKETKKF